MDRLQHVFNLDDFRKEAIERESLKKVMVEYDREDDMIDLRLNTTIQMTPVQASSVVSLIVEALRIRADFRKMGS